MAESTGFVIHLCDPCFDEWERALKERTSGGGKYELPEEEVPYLVETGEN
jgi:hypothetical protein